MKFLLLFAMLTAGLFFAGENSLKPVMEVLDEVAFQSDFSESKPFDKKKAKKKPSK